MIGDGQQAWRQHAACRGLGATLFYPDVNEDGIGQRTRADTDRAVYADAKQICAGCPVRALCADHALTTGERYGCWGGMSPRDRRQHGRRRRQLAAEGLNAIATLRAGVAS